MLLFNVVWPALYVSETMLSFWYLILATIFIEAFILKRFLKLATLKALLFSIVGNVLSGVVGTIFFTYFMLFWHSAFDNIVPGATGGTISWIVTYCFMFFGSVFIEIFAILLISRISINELLFPLSLGNLLTYVFIIVHMIIT